jgi:hypothetical protein
MAALADGQCACAVRSLRRCTLSGRDLREVQLLLVAASAPVATQLVAVRGTHFPPSAATVCGLAFVQLLGPRTAVTSKKVARLYRGDGVVQTKRLRSLSLHLRSLAGGLERLYLYDTVGSDRAISEVVCRDSDTASMQAASFSYSSESDRWNKAADDAGELAITVCGLSSRRVGIRHRAALPASTPRKPAQFWRRCSVATCQRLPHCDCRKRPTSAARRWHCLVGRYPAPAGTAWTRAPLGICGHCWAMDQKPLSRT